MARNRSRLLTDHDEIRRWAEERKAAPACVRRTGGNGDVGMIRLDFPGYSGQQSLEHIDWDEWFQKFDESNLALLVQDSLASGGRSNFNKLIGRETANAREEGNYRASRRKGTTGARAGSANRSTGRGRATASASRSASSSARSKRSASASEGGERSARTKRAVSSRTKSSGTSSRGREPGRAAARAKSSGSQSARGDVTRRSGTVAGRDRGRTSSSGGRQAQAKNTGRRSAKRNPEKVVKSARKIKQDADNIIRMERGGKRPSRVTKQTAAKSASATARHSRSGANARTRKRAA